MDSYFVTFTAYVDERKRPENFPHELKIKKVYDNIENVTHLQSEVNSQFRDLVLSAGLVVLKNEDEPLEEGKITFDKRIFVPWHLITYMSLDVKRIAKTYLPQDLIVPEGVNNKPEKETIN